MQRVDELVNDLIDDMVQTNKHQLAELAAVLNSAPAAQRIEQFIIQFLHPRDLTQEEKSLATRLMESYPGEIRATAKLIVVGTILWHLANPQIRELAKRPIREVAFSENAEGVDTFQCAICLKDCVGFIVDQKTCEGEFWIVELGCGHKFDKECVTEWFRNRKNCPLCRSNIT